MFGYFRPYEALSHATWRTAFTAHYCRLCYCLRNFGGQKARAFTTFDATIYGMVYSISKKMESPTHLPCQRFKKENMRKFASDDFGLNLARLSIIGFGELIRDDVIDGDHPLRVAFFNAVYGKMIRKAEKELAKATEISRQGTDKVNELQAKNAPLNEVLGAYGNTVAGTFLCFGDFGEDGYQLIRLLAEWTFFIDMLCDYDEDVKGGKPNTFYDGKCKTLKEYFDYNYVYVMEQNRRLTDAIREKLLAINDESDDWRAVYAVVTHALDTVVQKLLCGEDIKFHYFAELNKNYKEMHEHIKYKKLGKKSK